MSSLRSPQPAAHLEGCAAPAGEDLPARPPEGKRLEDQRRRTQRYYRHLLPHTHPPLPIIGMPIIKCTVNLGLIRRVCGIPSVLKGPTLTPPQTKPQPLPPSSQPPVRLRAGGRRGHGPGSPEVEDCSSPAHLQRLQRTHQVSLARGAKM